MTRKTAYAILIPICGILLVAIGFMTGVRFSKTANLEVPKDKLNTVLDILEAQYVDTLDSQRLADMTIASLFDSLDPHSEYIPKAKLQEVNEDLDGSFSGIGVSFQIVGDTVTVVDAIVGGPSEKAGIQAGDRIISANGEVLSRPGASNEDVFKMLRGPKGSKVRVVVARPGSSQNYSYDLVRADIPVNSVDAAYLMDDGVTGYIKLSKFTRTTYAEFMEALLKLDLKGAKSLILDLRSNPGGYMDQAIMIADEFLPKGRKIVYTKARTAENVMHEFSSGEGRHQIMPIAVLINEYSASASEIIAGAIQDNDRGAIVGRRSFGKGLVQQQFELPDSSALRITVARYYTPSGRSIQKEYKPGESIDYEMDILNRYDRGEFYHLDSIQLDKSKKFRTADGRIVYGGGGIMPDYFVPQDTTDITSYYTEVVNSGVIQQYAFKLADAYRPLLKNATEANEVLKVLTADDILLENLVNFAENKGIPARWYYANISARLLLEQLKAFIVRDILGYNQFYKIFNQTDRTIQVASDVLKNNKLPQTTVSK